VGAFSSFSLRKQRQTIATCLSGLPTISCLVESQVKEINHRAKGTEKFWNIGASGEAILHICAAIISDDEQLSNQVAARPGCQHWPNEKKNTLALAGKKRAAACSCGAHHSDLSEDVAG